MDLRPLPASMVARCGPGQQAPGAPFYGSYSSAVLRRLRIPTLLVPWLAVHPGMSLVPSHSRSCTPAPWAGRRPCYSSPDDLDLRYPPDLSSLGPSATVASPSPLIRLAIHLRAPFVPLSLRYLQVQ
ncbi:hypothetical protein D1007_52172 [Hordeum vulgare]|nr:hypothetical protein D1007_52172 [Hordeum vulgare]